MENENVSTEVTEVTTETTVEESSGNPLLAAGLAVGAIGLIGCGIAFAKKHGKAALEAAKAHKEAADEARKEAEIKGHLEALAQLGYNPDTPVVEETEEA